MIRTIKVMLIPNNRQKTRMFQYAGAARYAYNWTLERERANHENGGRFISDVDLRRVFTQHKAEPGKGWLFTISNNVTKQAIKDACDAFKRFFQKKAAFPRFKSRKRSRPSFYQDPVKLKFTETHVKVEGFASSKRKNRQKLNWIRLAEHGRIPVGVRYYNPRFTFDGLNWWVSVGVEFPDSDATPQGEGIGIDLGLKDLAILSDGTKYANINKSRKVRKLEKKKRGLQRSISRSYEKNKKKGKYRKTSNVTKKEKKLLRVHHNLTNIRTNYAHQITTGIAKREPSFVCMEDLNVSGMMSNRHLSKAVQQQSFRDFRRIMEYKCAWSHIRFITADRFFPSSKLCCQCGAIKGNLTLRERVYRCECCGNVIDRDFQAALNLKAYGETAV